MKTSTAAEPRPRSTRSARTRASRASRAPESRGGPVLDFTATARALGSGQLVVDRVFDEVFPWHVRRASSVHWTPVDVAMRAARMFALPPEATLLDVGAGVGKFCIVAAAMATGVNVRGIEHRSHFVDIARAAASKIGVGVDFTHGTLDQQDPAAIDGLYLFNPFAENISATDDQLDHTVELSEERYWRDVEVTERFLRAARTGMRVVTYCGWGGSMPSEYELVQREARGGRLELWVKAGYGSRALTGPRGDTRDDARSDVASLVALRSRSCAD